jgi:hypothetical protein
MDNHLPALFTFLKRRSEGNSRFRLEEVLSATKYKASSFRTYVGKGFFAPWIIALGGDQYLVKNFDLDWAAFERTMSQVRAGSSAVISNEVSWRKAVAALLAQGLDHGYSLTATELNLLSRLPKNPSK